ncbi:MAG TPA: DUF29 family protein [Bryobacteraceae bacterium]|nr:DUF29 family protein [Bryobacteraceae bacterium]
MEKSLKNIDDAYKWSIETVAALRAGDFSRIDMDELINEIGSIASGLRREMVSILKDIIESLLVLTYTTSDKDEAERQLVHAQGQLQLLLDSAPTLREAMAQAADKAYQRAKADVTEDYGVALPDTNPFPLERIAEDPYERLVAEGKLA